MICLSSEASSALLEGCQGEDFLPAALSHLQPAVWMLHMLDLDHVSTCRYPGYVPTLTWTDLPRATQGSRNDRPSIHNFLSLCLRSLTLHFRHLVSHVDRFPPESTQVSSVEPPVSRKLTPCSLPWSSDYTQG